MDALRVAARRTCGSHMRTAAWTCDPHEHGARSRVRWRPEVQSETPGGGGPTVRLHPWSPCPRRPLAMSCAAPRAWCAWPSRPRRTRVRAVCRRSVRPRHRGLGIGAEGEGSQVGCAMARARVSGLTGARCGATVDDAQTTVAGRRHDVCVPGERHARPPCESAALPRATWHRAVGPERSTLRAEIAAIVHARRHRAARPRTARST